MHLLLLKSSLGLAHNCCGLVKKKYNACNLFCINSLFRNVDEGLPDPFFKCVQGVWGVISIILYHAVGGG